MKHNKLIKTSVCEGLVACGCTAWAQNTNQAAVPPVVAAKARDAAMRPVEMLKQSLNLSDEQAKKLEPVLKEQQDKLNALRRDTSLSREQRLAKLKEIQQASDSKVRAQLTPEQAAKWTTALSQGQMRRQGTNSFHDVPAIKRSQAGPPWQTGGRQTQSGQQGAGK